MARYENVPRWNTCAAHNCHVMCRIVFANEHGRELSRLNVEKGCLWRDALAFIYAEHDMQSVRCVPYGRVQPVDMDSTVNGDSCVMVNVGDLSCIGVAVAPRKQLQRISVRESRPLREALMNVQELLWPGEELAPMWDPTTNQYRNPMDIDTPVRDMRKPVRVLGRIAKITVDTVSDIAESWPYDIQRIKVLGDGMWEVHSDEAHPHIVRRGTHYPVDRPPRRAQHVRL